VRKVSGLPPPYSKKQVRNAGRFLRDYDPHEVHGPDDFTNAIAVVDWWRAQHARPLRRTNALLRHHVRKIGCEPQVTQRLKRFTTIVDKLHRHPTMQLQTMEDIAGIRAVLPSQEAVDLLHRRLHAQRRWVIHRTREYVTGRSPGPKNDGYRAVHLIVVRDGCFVEIQLRTPWQDAWAQSVEQDTRILSHGLKFGAGPADLRDYYRVVADLYETREMQLEPGHDLLGDLAHLFALTRRYYAGGEHL
jgi:putative GTP pyrophosphokinase